MIEKVTLKKDRSSFTLLELILIIAIVSILLGSSLPLINNNIKSTSFKSFVNKTYLLFDYARTRAILTNSKTEIVLDLDGKTISLIDVSAVEPNSPQGGEVLLVRKLQLPQKVNIRSEKSRIVFFPDGTSNDFIFTITDKDMNNIRISSLGFDGKILIN